MSLVILGELHFHPDDVGAAVAAAAKHAAITRHEAGCRHFAFAIDVLSPEILRISEWWEDEASLRAHLAREHVATFLATIATLRMTKGEGTQYIVSSFGDAPA